MIFRNRDYSLTHTQAIRRDKEQLVLEWLLEFRFSSVLLLTQLLEQSTRTSSRFFNRLISDGLIRPFTNVHTRGYNYVMLTLDGLSYLEASGCDVSVATTRVKNLGRYSRIIHDIAVQEAVLDQRKLFSSVRYERNLTDEQVGTTVPDALLSDSQGHHVALEVERWRKDNNRIRLIFEAHARAIHDGIYHGVHYRFEQAADLEHYRSLLFETSWSRYQRLTNGKYVSTGELFSIDELDPDDDLRESFSFSHKGFMSGSKDP